MLLLLSAALLTPGYTPAQEVPPSGDWTWEWAPAAEEGVVAAEVSPFRYGKSWAYSVEIDDGPTSTLTVSQPLLAQYSATDAPPGVRGGRPLPFVGSAATIAMRTGTPNATFLNWEQLRQLREGGWDVANHGYAHAGNHWEPKAALTPAQVRRELFWSQAVFVAELGEEQAPSHFVYPNGYTAYQSHLPEFGLRSGSRVAGTSRPNVLSSTFVPADLNRNYLDESVWSKTPDPLLGLPAAPKLGETVIDFTHGMEADPASPNGVRWRARLGHLASRFGAKGDDSMWCAPTSEVVAYALARKAARVECTRGRLRVSLPGGPATRLTLHLTGVHPGSKLQAPPGGTLYRQGTAAWITTPVLGRKRDPSDLPRVKRVYRGPVRNVRLERSERVAAVRLLQFGRPAPGFELSLEAVTAAGRESLYRDGLPENWGAWVLFPTFPERAAPTATEVTVTPDPCLKEMEIWVLADPPSPPAVTTPPFRLQLDTLSKGYDGKTCWVHARAGTIPGPAPTVVVTMQKLLLSGSDVFYALNEMRSDDLGKTWRGPIEHGETLGRRAEPKGVVVATCDFTPKWHAATKKLLGTGQTVRYQGDKVIAERPRETSFSVYDAAARTWSPWDVVEMPKDGRFYSSGAGSTQRLDLPNGEILLPIYFKARGEKDYRSASMRCEFDGKRLTYLAHGTELTLPGGRGLYEPSLTKFGDRYFMTLRNDLAGYVAVSRDGMRFDKPQVWRFDDGTELGNYNTQQHWVTHSDGLFLVYTRRGANNDHVFRHRAPLFIAQVDPARLCVLRATERILIPQRGARLGNFAVTAVSPDETWVTVTEWMQPAGCEKYGSDNSVYAARILWSKPNTLHDRL